MRLITLDCGGSPIINSRLRHFSVDTQEAVFVIYDDNGAGGLPGTRLYYSTPWWDAGNTVVQTIQNTTGYALVAGSYWVGTQMEGTSRAYVSDAISENTYRYVSAGTFPTPPADLTGLGSLTTTLDYETWLSF